MGGTDLNKWKIQKCFFKISSPWLTILGENIEDDKGQLLDYWRVEKADSVIALTLQEDNIVLPSPSYRPGISKLSLDFPGGRISDGSTPEKAVRRAILRELCIRDSDISELLPLNAKGWPINSSFSNQHLFGYVAKINKTSNTKKKKGISFYPSTDEGIERLLNKLTCLQCRNILLEWASSYRNRLSN